MLLSPVPPGTQFAAIVYSDRVKQYGAPWGIHWKFMTIHVDIASATLHVSHYGKI